MIQICLVLYNCSLAESRAVQSLVSLNKKIQQFSVNIYLNGNCKVNCEYSQENFCIIDNNKQNLYLLPNYYKCIDEAYKSRKKWIAFFDQDTEISLDYINTLLKSIKTFESSIAFYPFLKSADSIISPIKLKYGIALFPNALDAGEQNSIDLVALNSGSVYNIDFIKSLGIIDENFKLDYLDIYISYRVFRSKKSFVVMDTVLEHDLSILNDKPIGAIRDESILSAQYHYYKKYRNKFSYLLYKTGLVYLFSVSLFRNLLCGLKFVHS